MKSKAWHLTMTPNHWASRVTMMEWVDKVLQTYHITKCVELGLDPENQKLLLILDCWSVHCSKMFTIDSGVRSYQKIISDFRALPHRRTHC